MTETTTRPQSSERQETEPPRRWNVVLLDDQEHTYEYVIRMMQALFGHSLERAWQIARAVDTEGRAVCLTTHREYAELKRDQIRAYGPDPVLHNSRGSMAAILEPAELESEGSSGPSSE